MKNNCGTKKKSFDRNTEAKKNLLKKEDAIDNRKSWVKKLSSKKCFEIDSNVIAEKIFDT